MELSHKIEKYQIKRVSSKETMRYETYYSKGNFLSFRAILMELNQGNTTLSSLSEVSKKMNKSNSKFNTFGSYIRHLRINNKIITQ